MRRLKYYPLMFRPIYKDMVWGGECWDITCREDNMSVVENGLYGGKKTLEELIKRDRAGLLGERIETFPLLYKIIDARADLSVQVHPDDEYARRRGESGKDEMWYILDRPRGGKLIAGLKPGVTRASLEKAIKKNSVEECLTYLTVERGMMLDIPAGLVHALTRGAMVTEIQQNSDVTYRLYDYNRAGLDGKPRELHIADALEVIDYDQRAVYAENTISNNYFSVSKYEIRNEIITETSDSNAFTVFTCVCGNFDVTGGGVEVTVEFGRSVLIPAALGAYSIAGCATALKSAPIYSA